MRKESKSPWILLSTINVIDNRNRDRHLLYRISFSKSWTYNYICICVIQGHQPPHPPVHHAGALVLRWAASHTQTSEGAAGEDQRVLRSQPVVQERGERGRILSSVVKLISVILIYLCKVTLISLPWLYQLFRFHLPGTYFNNPQVFWASANFEHQLPF